MMFFRRLGNLRIGWIVLALATLSLAVAQAEDWPQWRGPHHNGISAESGWLSRWPPSGPRRVWAVQVGQGYSSVAVVGTRVYTMGNSGNQDTVYCLNAGTGGRIWNHSYPCAAGEPSGTRATPTV